MSCTRRAFLIQGGVAAAACAVATPLESAPPLLELPRCGGRWLPTGFRPKGPIRPTLDVSTLRPFVDPLPIPALAQSHEKRAAPGLPDSRLPYYRIAMRESEWQAHRDMKATRCWTYGGSLPGPSFETRSHGGILVEWANELPRQHFLPIDRRLHGAEPGQPEVRTVVHLHGGRTPHASDGYPEAWYPPGQSALFHYPLPQDATTLWYHDHAMGINRLNVYAGLFGAFIVRDAIEDQLKLPSGAYDIPLLLCDRLFYRDDHQLYYPTSDDLNAPWVPDIQANGALINGKLFPYLEVEPCSYRFRLIGAANSRLFRLLLSNQQSFLQIGSDQGLLAQAIPTPRLLLAPGERADVIIDFSALGGQHIQLKNDAIEILQFRVKGGGGSAAKWSAARLRPIARMAVGLATQRRPMTLGEQDDRVGNPLRMLLNHRPWDAPVTETPTLGSVEMWEFLNLTDDIHPIHLHMVRFQVLERQVFHPPDYLRSRKLVLSGPALPPLPTEMGWKDTVQAYPGMITRIMIRFEGYVGRYLWHCHIMEHEANDMMRPYDVLPPR